MPKRRKVNLYKRHLLRKKLGAVVLSMLCCLAVMAVGVYASASQSFTVSIKNDVDIMIADVDGELSFKRHGGVYADTMADAGDPATNYDEFVVLYNKNDASTSVALNNLINDHLDVNYIYNNIEYIFKYVVEDDTLFDTNIELSFNAISAFDTTTVNENTVNQVEVSYKYFVGATEPASWNGVGINNFASSGTSINISAGQCVYIRCYAKYNTEYFGKQTYESPWEFTLYLSESTT